MVRIRCIDANGKEMALYDLDPTDTLETLMVLIAAEHGIEVDSQFVSREGTGAAQATWSAATHAGTTLQELGLAGAETCTLKVGSSDPVKQRLLKLFGTSAAARATAPTGTASAPAQSAPSRPQTHPSGLWNVESNADMQERLYKAIQQRNIDESLANALEFTPEAFGSVIMLYVDCVINGQTVKAFVDSGAQMSIMNVPTAERCGLMRLLDTRMAGVAVGVGTQKILGQIHMAPVSIGGLHIPFAFRVLESQSMDVIIGLDQLRRHQMIIDLRHNCLCIGEASVPFLGEADLPDYAKPARQDEEFEGEQGKTSDAEKHKGAEPATSAPASSAAPASVPDNATAAQGKMVGDFMALTGIEDRELARGMLEASQWNVDAAAALFFDDS